MCFLFSANLILLCCDSQAHQKVKVDLLQHRPSAQQTQQTQTQPALQLPMQLLVAYCVGLQLPPRYNFLLLSPERAADIAMVATNLQDAVQGRSNSYHQRTPHRRKTVRSRTTEESLRRKKVRKEGANLMTQTRKRVQRPSPPRRITASQLRRTRLPFCIRQLMVTA